MPFRLLARFGAIVLAAAIASLNAHASSPYNAIIVFGDSYNDVGNIAAIAAQFGVIYPPPPYYEGRFSNGPIWVEHIAGAWNLPMAPSILGGNDWAEGGAELLQSVTVQQIYIPSIQVQVQEYLQSNGGRADPNALYVIEGGGNDILDNTPDPALGSKIADGLNGMVLTLSTAGAKNFLVPDLIDVSQLPAAQALGSAFATYATSIVTQVNQKLAAAPEAGVLIHRIPTFQTFHDIAYAGTHYGFKNVTTPCLSSTLAVCADPDHTLWWDAEHPSEFGHTVFAVLVEGRVQDSSTIGTTITLAVNPATSLVAGEQVTLTATVTPVSGTGAPTGNVTFADPTGGSVTVPLVAGVAVYSGKVPPGGTYSVYASYNGGLGFAGSKSATITSTVAAPPPA